MHHVQYDIQQEITHAYSLFVRYGKSIAEDIHLSEMIDNYRACIDNTSKKMSSVGVVQNCIFCAERTGSCCFQEIERCYDWVILLANLLMGEKLPTQRETAGNCFFLGTTGCKLLARYSFCINYLCTNIKSTTDPTAIVELSSISGSEIYTGWETEQALRRWISARTL